jgi:type I restriction enzyme M protein
MTRRLEPGVPHPCAGVGQNGNTGGGRSLSKKDWDFLRAKALWGHEVNRCTYRMDLLNVYLHGIDEPNLRRIDTLGPGTHVGRSYDVVLSNPPTARRS